MNLDVARENDAYKKFETDALNGTISHAYVLIGEDSELRETLLTLVAMRTLCKNACGECAACKKVLNGEYVELIRLNAAEKIPESAISELTEKVLIKPVEGEKKIVIIDNADLLTARAQNRLLKTYEEPPAYLTVFLGAGNESGLLATIKSRAKKLYLSDIPSAYIERMLKEDGFDDEKALIAATFCMGNYTRALQFCEDEKYGEIYDEAFGVMLNLKKSSQVAEFAGKEIFNKEKIPTTFDFMEIILCDIMKTVTASGAPLFTVHREFDLKKASEGFNAQSVAMAITAINNGRKRINANMNANVTAGSVLMEILEAKYKWQ